MTSIRRVHPRCLVCADVLEPEHREPLCDECEAERRGRRK